MLYSSLDPCWLTAGKETPGAERLELCVRTETLVNPAPSAVISMGVPVVAIWPLSRMAILSAISSASAMSCVARMMVVPAFCCSRMISCSSTRVATSSPAVGSSRKSTEGSCASARASESRRCWPVESWWYCASLFSDRPRRSKRSYRAPTP